MTLKDFAERASDLVKERGEHYRVSVPFYHDSYVELLVADRNFDHAKGGPLNAGVTATEDDLSSVHCSFEDLVKARVSNALDGLDRRNREYTEAA